MNSSVAWGDYDNDNDLDVLLTGCTDDDCNSSVTKIYENKGNDLFEEISTFLKPVSNSSVTWGDYDNDGDLDILLAGWDKKEQEYITNIYRNDKSNFVYVQAGLLGVSDSFATWGDYDNDSDLDIFLTGKNNDNVTVSKIYRNDKGMFTDINISLKLGTATWGDYDNDGDLDIFQMGCISECYTIIYQNEGGDNFIDINIKFAGIGDFFGIAKGTTGWADMDNDGDLDLLLTGCMKRDYEHCSSSPGRFLFWNDGYSVDSGWVFTYADIQMQNVSGGTIDWGDYDNDGDLDILLTGYGDYESVANVYRNMIETPNTQPSPPTDLSSSIEDRDVTLSWNTASDAETPSTGLTYNLRVGTTPGGSEIVSPMANFDTGYRHVVEMGNANHGLTATLRNLAGGTYYWSVQAIDTSFAGSAFSEEATFTLDRETYMPNILKEYISPDLRLILNVTANRTQATYNDTIGYTYQLINSSNVPLTNLSLIDDRVKNIETLPNQLGVGQTVSVKGEYTVGITNLVAITNVATVTGEYAGQSVSATGGVSVDVPTTELSAQSNNAGDITVNIKLAADETVTIPSCDIGNNQTEFCRNLHANIAYKFEINTRCGRDGITKMYDVGEQLLKITCR
ncbi:FG-GAP-like repeat-containing protein [Anaerolineales bacterium HSG25]|nr:FG-GAP-like repeat-containing protein [Anaerolineales bacterium HSG25]